MRGECTGLSFPLLSSSSSSDSVRQTPRLARHRPYGGGFGGGLSVAVAHGAVHGLDVVVVGADGCAGCLFPPISLSLFPPTGNAAAVALCECVCVITVARAVVPVHPCKPRHRDRRRRTEPFLSPPSTYTATIPYLVHGHQQKQLRRERYAVGILPPSG